MHGIDEERIVLEAIELLVEALKAYGEGYYDEFKNKVKEALTKLKDITETS